MRIAALIALAGGLLAMHGLHSPMFIDATAISGLNFHHVNGAQGSYYLPEIMGSGVAFLDFDNDGDLDVFVVQARGGNRLFRMN